MPTVFFKKGGLPLKILYEKTEPPNWSIGLQEKNPKVSGLLTYVCHALI